MKRPEQQLQQACVKWFALQYSNQKGRLFMCHQNGKNAVEQAILKSMGLVAGVSDLIYLSNSGAVFIELKAGKNKQSEAQQYFQSMVESLGMPYHLIRSFDKFKALIESLQ